MKELYSPAVISGLLKKYELAPLKKLGQNFLRDENIVEKIAQAARLREENGWHYKIMIDGSCNKKTFRKLYEAGADAFILGSSGLFSLDADLKTACDTMKRQFEQETGLKR